MNDTFNFYGDKRNNIHLLLYFTVYNDKYDVFPGELPVVLEAIDQKIHIIFIVNKCPDNIFNDEDEMDDLKNDIKEARKGTDFEKYKTYFINCVNSKGFDLLLDGIFEKYKKNIIPENYLKEIEKCDIEQSDFNKLIKNSFFFGNTDPKDVFLNESLLTSVLDIKELIVKLAGYYSGELGFFKSIGFYFNSKIYNQFWRDSEKNFFPLLTDLVKKIYSNFGIEKSYEECNNYIKIKIAEYFDIDLPKLKDAKKQLEKEEVHFVSTCEGPKAYEFNMDKFKKDFINLGRIFWNSQQFYNISEKLAESNLKDKSKLEEKIFNTNGDIQIDSERLLKLIKRDFGLDNTKRDATSQEKIYQKLFYISYTCNELISLLCGETNQKGFKYKSIYNFFYHVSSAFNDAINGFIKIKEEMKEREKELKKFKKEKKKSDVEDKDAPPMINKEEDE